jgi:phosphoenolpyruvate---glycerone phosphotransferase subunit DhaL
MNTKTMVDALAPAAVAARASVGLPIQEALRHVAAAADAGKEASKNMIAQFGRARTLGEACLGFPDAGAISVTIILQTMSDFAEQ